ncbi:sugar ABC transporter ATP-binding protein [Actinomadura sp.]|jgi:ABC-type sugar transport system ATPase subunit|uniref:sugar ABC transporter ATP-binding protein n=1 Tax=Actinomadura sp. TaxID=1989 RepID=UPI0037CA9C98
MSSLPALEAVRVSKSFGGTRALVDVSLAVEKGAVTSIVGANGAGKSTFVKIISGVEQPDDGYVALGGERDGRLTPARAADGGVRVVHQHTSMQLVGDLSVADNLYLGRLTARRGIVRPDRVRAHAAEVLDAFGLTGDLDMGRSCASLSPVGKRLLLIASAAFSDPSVLILDEPTATLPPREAERVHDLVRRLAAAGTAVILISHRLAEVQELSDRIVVFRDGRLVADHERGGASIERLLDDLFDVGVDLGQAPPERDGPARREREPVLEVRELAGGKVQPTSFTVGAGEIVGLTGLVGAGQSELLSMVYGASERESGEVRYKGALVPGDCRLAAARGIGFIPADRADALVPSLSSYDNIALSSPRRAPGLAGRRRAELAAASRWLTDIRFVGDPKAQVATLSGGNQQKVVLARWLAAGVDLLLLDEPTAGIDVSAKAEVHHIIRDFAERGGTVLVSSSDTLELAAICDRVLVMVEGRVTAEILDPDEATISRASYQGANGWRPGRT